RRGGEGAQRTRRPRTRQTRARERKDDGRLLAESAAARRAARDVVSRQRFERHAVSSERRLSWFDYRHAQPGIWRRTQPGILERLSNVELWLDRQLSARSQLRSGEPRSRRSGTAAGYPADREPASTGGGSGTKGRPPDSQHRRTRRRGARRANARRGAIDVGAPSLRSGLVDDVPRDAGPARSARGRGQPAADDARLRISDRELRSGAAGAAARGGRHGG